MTLADSAPMGIAVPAAGFYTITVRGALDRMVGARLLRLIDARLQMASYGHTITRHVLLEVTGLHAVDPGGDAALRHAAHACDRRGITFDLVGAAAVGPHLTIGARQALARYRSFPDVAAAVAALSD